MVTRIVVFCTLFLAGCASVSKSHTRPDPAAVVLHVENHNWSDAIIYVVRSGSRFRLGDVRSQQRKALSVPTTFTNMGTLELWIRFIGSKATLTTHPIPISPGQQVEVTLYNYIPLSTVIPLATVGVTKWADATEHELMLRPRIFPLKRAFTGIQEVRQDV